jgi:uncharacterized RDD family membrane protein YckC
MPESSIFREPLTGRIRLRRRGPVFMIYAGFVSRLMAMVVDLLVIFAIWLTFSASARFISQTSGISAILGLLKQELGWITPLQTFIVTTTFDVVALLTLGFVYFTLLYSFGGATVGKYLLGLRVVRTDGKPLRIGHAALRVLAYAASSLPLYFGFLNVLIDDRRRAWHDLLIRTVVVHSWEARPDETFLREIIDRLH